MKRIPRFTHEEAGDIEGLFVNDGIPFGSEAVNINVGSYGAATEYLFLVSDEYFLEAVVIIKSYFNFSPCEKEPYSGTCPACNSAVMNVSECPDCGLVLVPSPDPSLKEHPFHIFLEQQNLLEEK